MSWALQPAPHDPADAAGLSRELRELTFELSQGGYERRSGYEECAPLHLAWESAREAIATLRAGHRQEARDVPAPSATS